jgi:predicted DCC family thiol-disulfide oxidoreductase YuxK
MLNNWTGGQYSVFRAALGVYLIVHFVYLLPWSAEIFSSAGMLPQASLSPLTKAFPNILGLVDHPRFVQLFCLSGGVAAILLTVGRHDRLAALWIWYVLACLFGRNPLIQNPSLPYTGWMLLLHAALPRAPFGSLEARGRADPASNWAIPSSLFAAAWIVMAVSYSYSGYTKLFSPSWVSGDTVAAVLRNPLARDWILRDTLQSLPDIVLKSVTWFILYIELLFAPLALWSRARPWLWGGMLLVQFGFAALLRFPDLTAAMILFHVLTLDPGWLKRKSLAGVTVFYDGQCALCHGTVRFLIAEDTSADLRYAPLSGETHTRLLPDAATHPASMIVRTPNGSTLIEDDAVVYLLDHLGGLWRALTMASRFLPKSLRRAAYRFIGDRRYRLFGTAKESCPVTPAHLQRRIRA